ncbi:MAG: hypothetical protein ACI9SE_000435 [Neolewinella sp.]
MVERGNLTIWLSPDAIARWNAKPSGRRGGQRKHSGIGIETALTLRLLLSLPLRQVEGLMGLALYVPDQATLSRRGKHLKVSLRVPKKPGRIDLVIDSSGLAIFGEGEWAAVKHGGWGIRGWKKLHLGVDGDGVIVGQVLTGISWPAVGNIAERVVAEYLDPDRFRGIKRIAVDEISFGKRHRYLTVVTDHDSRKVIWVVAGKSSDVLKIFFTGSWPDACEAIEIATIDMSAAYRKAILEGLANAQIISMSQSWSTKHATKCGANSCATLRQWRLVSRSVRRWAGPLRWPIDGGRRWWSCSHSPPSCRIMRFDRVLPGA